VEQKILQPFLKWPGGKRWFVRDHSHLLPKSFDRYIEPFLGAGAVFFRIRPQQAILGDINTDLVSAYNAMKANWQNLLTSLQDHQRLHCTKHFYQVRDRKPQDVLSQASRMIYLNRTCFNGIYRVNTKGEFNVPIGNRNEVLHEDDNFQAISGALQHAEIRNADFEVLIDEAVADDFLFVDPPYTVRHNMNGFIKYNEKLFSWEDQERLATALERARMRGVQIVSTNANHYSIRDLYDREDFELIEVSRFSPVSASGQSRKDFEELVILSNVNPSGHAQPIP
jgi:DNA adenine methylase